jgi:cytosine/uracil/thiamine/allantoin permease
MVISAMVVAVLLASGWNIPQIFLALAIANTIVAAGIVKLPQSQNKSP